MLKRFSALFAFLALLAPLAATPALAVNPVAFEFSATVDGSFDLTGGLIPVPAAGTTLAGTYLFDADADDALPSVPTAGTYSDAISCMLVDWDGGHTLDLAVADPLFEAGDISVFDGGDDLYSVSMVSNTVDFDASPVDRASAQMFLQAPAGGTIVGDALPAVPPDPLDFTTLRSLVLIITPDATMSIERAEIAATLETLTLGSVPVCPVPEPGFGALFAAGISSLLVLRRA